MKAAWRFFVWCILWRLPIEGMPKTDEQWRAFRQRQSDRMRKH